MTAINENGQVYFTFEELDIEGAIVELVYEIISVINKIRSAKIDYHYCELGSAEEKKALKEFEYWNSRYKVLKHAQNNLKILGGYKTVRGVMG